VHQPADVGRKLLRLRSGQNHGVVKRVEETVLADPAPPLDQLRVHHGDLPSRATEAYKAELQPVKKRREQGHRGGRGLGHRLMRRPRGGGGLGGCGHGSSSVGWVESKSKIGQVPGVEKRRWRASSTDLAAASRASSPGQPARRPASTASRPAASATGRPPMSR